MEGSIFVTGAAVQWLRDGLGLIRSAGESETLAGTANSLLMQFQADVLGIPIQCAAVSETTALGAGYLAGLAVGLWRDTSELSCLWRAAKTYEPRMSVDQREALYAGWKRAVERARKWAES